MKYIALQDLIDHGKELCFQSADQIAKVYEQLPSVEIVRCNDCKFSHEDKWMGKTLCERYTDSHETDKDGFCSKGKRRAMEREKMTKRNNKYHKKMSKEQKEFFKKAGDLKTASIMNKIEFNTELVRTEGIPGVLDPLPNADWPLYKDSKIPW